MKKAFTMIEMLIVISIIGVLAGVLLSVINVDRQRDMASDSVRRASIEQIIESMEAHFAVEGYYPAATDDASIQIYMSSWPDDTPKDAVYNYGVDATGAEFGVTVATARTGINYKYRSTWGEIMECANALPGNDDCN